MRLGSEIRSWLIFFSLTFVCDCQSENLIKKCGKLKTLPTVVNRIFGGTELSKVEFPWLVALHHRKTQSIFCAGSLISSKHVLSAAHCFQQKGDQERLGSHEFMCMLGRYNVTNDKEVGSVNSLVLEVLVHPEWNFASERFHADISLVVLFDVLTFSDTIHPVCLPEPSFDEVTGTGKVVGWGKSGKSGANQYDSIPSKVDIPAVNGSYCYVTYSKLAPHSSHTSFCGGYEDKGKAPCLGDSGGGFYLKKKCRWNVRGIISGALYDSEFGCDINKFQLYTNVAKFIDWIKKIVQETSETVWTNVDLDCSMSIGDGNQPKADCTTKFNGPWTQSLKISSVFFQSASQSAAAVKILHIRLNYMMYHGIGEKFPNLQKLTIAIPSNSVTYGVPPSIVKNFEIRHFSNMTGLKELEITYNTYEIIADKIFQHLTNLRVLKLKAFRTTIPDDFFASLPKLTELNIEGNSLTEAGVNNIKSMSSLEVLNLEQCSVKTLPKDFFNNLGKIKKLNLLGYFEDIDLEIALEHLPHLEYFSMQFSNETKNIGRKIPKLKYLKLSGVRFLKLEKAIFTTLFDVKMENLEEIVFQICHFTEISDHAFEDMASLKYLDFSYCRVRVVREKSFWKLKKLKRLLIVENPIKDAGLPENVFQDLFDLEYLSLSTCEIDVLPENLFANLRKLVELDFNYNRVKTIPPNTFKNLENLKYLNLDNCGLTSLAPDLFSNNLKLLKLKLGANRFKTVDADFRGLSNIKEIELEGECFRGYFRGEEANWRNPRFSSVQEFQEAIKLKCSM